MTNHHAYVVRDGALALVERPAPALQPHEVAVRVRATSLNYRDLMVLRGNYARGAASNVVPLSDGAGEVVEVGSAVTQFAVGDRVAGTFMQKWTSGPIEPHHGASALGGAIDGMLAERVVLAESGLVRIPDYLSYEQAATLPCAAVTAWNGLFETGSLKPGQTVLVQGTGGVSIAALQLARAAGARVVVTSSSDAKLERARTLGAAGTINYKTTPEWSRAARELTGGLGVDHIVEVGGAGTFDESLSAIRLGGTISYIGVLTGAASQIKTQKLLLTSAHVNGIFVGSRSMFEALCQALEVSRVVPVVDRVFSFSEAPEAYKYFESQAHFGKVVITVE
ncbi:MAG: NAD(P)-dependent alcohol dehydrogenase [Labilithrix sp.]|nr:NAD(P)-dependent alcohol dehydrogenase [Labilithrix sp.]